MRTERMHMNTNARLVSKVLTKNKNTFYALKELINNSIQAQATRIEIDLVPFNVEQSDLMYGAIDKIRICDNGHGVPFSKFSKSILEVATDNKPDGCGVGRFSGLQIGQTMRIHTVGYDEKQNGYTKTSVEFSASQFQKDDITSIEFPVETELLDGYKGCEYEVVISKLYSNEGGCPKKNMLGEDFILDNFKLKLFEHYPNYIFEESVAFIVNGEKLTRAQFVTETPKSQEFKYTDSFGKEHDIRLYFYSLKLKDPKVRLFVQCPIGGIKTTTLELSYNSMWYAASMGTQYITIESDYITQDFIEANAIGEINPEWKKFTIALKAKVDEFFKKGNKKYLTFLDKLRSDKAYPYKTEELSELKLSTEFFDQSAFIIEDDLKLLHNNNANRTLIYLLLRKVIDDGDLSFVINHVMGLSKESQEKMVELIDKADLGDAIRFSNEIASRLHTINLIYRLAFTEVDKSKEYYDGLEKILFKNLWLFGDEYSNSMYQKPSDHITSIFQELVGKYVPKVGDKKLDCQRTVKPAIKKLESLFVLNERRLDYDKKEITCVIVFAPSIKVNQKITSRIDNMLVDLLQTGTYSKECYTFKLYFLASEIDSLARMRIKTTGPQKFTYSLTGLDGEPIRAFLTDWVSFIEHNQEKYTCASEEIQLKRSNVETSIIQDYPEVFERRNNAQMRIIK